MRLHLLLSATVFLGLTLDAQQLRLSSGVLTICQTEPGYHDIETPQLVFRMLRPGSYSVEISEDGLGTIVTVRSGDADVLIGEQRFSAPAGNQIRVSGVDSLNFEQRRIPEDQRSTGNCIVPDDPGPLAPVNADPQPAPPQDPLPPITLPAPPPPPVYLPPPVIYQPPPTVIVVRPSVEPRRPPKPRLDGPVNVPATPTPAPLAPTPPAPRPVDRKSTRLNSSHTDISRMPSSA